jgi:hypothetical protein
MTFPHRIFSLREDLMEVVPPEVLLLLLLFLLLLLLLLLLVLLPHLWMLIHLPLF